VTFGQLISSAAAITFENEGKSLMPYAPAHVNATGFGGDITITWVRRGRYFNEWRDSVDVPLGEDSESYEVDILDVGSPITVVRTLSSSSESVTYTAAHQLSDFGSPIPPDPLLIRLYQISATVGRGFVTEAELSP
jgi:hypothetical protein